MKKRLLIYGALAGLCLLLLVAYILIQPSDTDVAAQTPPVVQGTGSKAKQEKTPAKEESKEERPKDEAGFDKAVYGMSWETHDKLQKRFEQGV